MCNSLKLHATLSDFGVQADLGTGWMVKNIIFQRTLWHVNSMFGSSQSAGSAYQEMRSDMTQSLHISNFRTKPAGIESSVK